MERLDLSSWFWGFLHSCGGVFGILILEIVGVGKFGALRFDLESGVLLCCD